MEDIDYGSEGAGSRWGRAEVKRGGEEICDCILTLALTLRANQFSSLIASVYDGQACTVRIRVRRTPAGRICLSPIQLRGYESTVANRQWLMKAVDSGFCQCSYCFRGIWNSCTRARSYTALYSLSSLFILLHYTFAAEVTFSLHRLSVSKKGKVLPYSLPSVGPGADPGVQAVSPQVTWSYPSGGRLPLLSARPAVTFPTKERHRSSAGTKLYCLVTEVQACEQLAQGCYLEANLPRFEPKTFRITSKRSTVKPHRPHSLLVNNTKSCGWMFTKCRNLVEHGHTRIECVLEVFQNILWIS